MSKSLDEIRAKLQALDSGKGAQRSGSGDKTTYPHWNIAEGTSAVLRFLPDANEDNTFFWAERQMIKLSFPGIKGHDENKAIEIQVPCVEMWDGKMSCPILNEVRPWWKDASMEKLARQYWAKKSYYMQGFVKQDPMNETEAPDNPIRKFVMGPQIFAIIKAALMDPDMAYSPVDYINGTDFMSTKTSKGGYSDYGTSKWARKETSLSEEMQDAISQYGLVDLATYLPKKPSKETLEIIFDMFQESLDGKLYDPAKWSQHFKPYGFESGSAEFESKKPSREAFTPRAQTPTPVAATPSLAIDADWEDEVSSAEKTFTPAPAVSAAPAGKSPAEILAMLRSRKQ